MKREDIIELHYITDIANILSIIEDGILSHNLADRESHVSVADNDVQERRKNKEIPGTGKTLHDFANLYFDAHNPMLSRLRSKNDSICILRINSSILDLPEIIVSDRNAARGWARFWPVEEGLPMLDKDMVFAESWKHPVDQMKEDEHKGVKCSEILVPSFVSPKYVLGAYVANETAKNAFCASCNLPVEIKPSIFF